MVSCFDGGNPWLALMNTPEAVLNDSLHVADRMYLHLARSYRQIEPLIPLSSAQVSELDDAAIDILDLYLSRCGKLQDFMVGKLFRALARASLEDTSQDVSSLDTLNRMAKFGVVQNIDDWLKARLMRNAFAHEYLIDDAAIADNINGAAGLFGLLQDTLAQVRAFQRAHIARSQ